MLVSILEEFTCLSLRISDLFLYGLNEEQAIEKIKQIERNVKDSILAEVTTIRTKNAITIASAYPIRHVQIVLRLYDSISQILTGNYILPSRLSSQLTVIRIRR